MNMDTIHSLCLADSLRWTNHIVLRLLQRGIPTEEVISTPMHGEIIEQYPEDYPCPSCLVLSFDNENVPYHVVCGASESELWLITAYVPEETEWMTGYRMRRERN